MQIAEIAKIIGGILSENDKIKSIVEDATGEDPYNVYTNDRLPRAQQIAEILDKLEKVGKERWLLTRVLMEPMPDESLRAIAKAYPKTLQSLPLLQNQVGRVQELLRNLLSLLPLAVAGDVQLKPGNVDFTELSGQSARLFAFKSLHETLHALQLRLSYGILPESDIRELTALDLESCRKRMIETCDHAADVAALLGKGSPEEEKEFAWINRLRNLAGQGQSAPDTSCPVAEALRLDVLRLIRPQLARLNGQVLKAAKALSLTILGNLPPDMDDRIREDLSFAIRDLKPTVLARALKQKLWQDTENEFALFADSFAKPQEDLARFTREWFALKSRIQWLTELDPHLKWAEDARKYVDEISDQLIDDKFKPSLETCRKLTSLCFFAIDAMLKTDCSSLREVGRPLPPVSPQAAPSRNLH